MQLIQHFLKDMHVAMLQLSKAEVSTFQNSWKPQSKLSKHFVKKNLTSLKCNFPSIISSHTEFPGTISQQAVILNHLYVVKTLRRHKSYLLASSIAIVTLLSKCPLVAKSELF